MDWESPTSWDAFSYQLDEFYYFSGSLTLEHVGGAEGDRTADLMTAREILNRSLRIDKLPNAIDLAKQENLVAAKYFVDILVFDWLGSGNTTSHARRKKLWVLFYEARSIVVYSIHQEWKFRHIGDKLFVILRDCVPEPLRML